MKLKLLVLCFITLALFVGVSNAETLRYNGTGNWTDNSAPAPGWVTNGFATGFIDRAPDTGDTCRINWGGGTVTLDSSADAGDIQVGVDESGTLIITNNGALTTVAGGWSGLAAGGMTTGEVGKIIIDGGSLTINDTKFQMGVGNNGTGGDAVLVINNGSMTVNGTFSQTNGNINPYTYLNGGTLTVDALDLTNGVIDLAGGHLVIAGNHLSDLATWTNAGLMTADGGAVDSYVYSSYDGANTTFTAVPEPAAVGVIGVVGLLTMLIRRRLLS